MRRLSPIAFLLCSLLLGAAPGRPLCASPPHVESLGPGVQIDWTAATVESAGSCAADLRAPSAEVARVKAERVARERARDRLRQALLALPKARLGGSALDPAAVDAALEHAETVSTSYGSTGSVTLLLRLQLSALPSNVSPPGEPDKKKSP